MATYTLKGFGIDKYDANYRVSPLWKKKKSFRLLLKIVVTDIMRFNRIQWIRTSLFYNVHLQCVLEVHLIKS